MLGGGHMLAQQIQERSEVSTLGGRIERRASSPGVGVDDRELDLRLVGVQIEEQLVYLVDHLPDPSIRPIHLVDDENHRQP